MGSVDKAAIVWTIAIVLIGASVAIVGSNFDQADSKQDMKMTGSMNDDMMMQDGKMTDMEKMMDYDRDSSGDKTTEKMMGYSQTWKRACSKGCLRTCNRKHDAALA